MSASWREGNRSNAGGETSIVSSVARWIAKMIANPYGVVCVALLSAAIVGVIMSARQPSSVTIPQQPRNSASDENVTRSLRTMEKLVDKLPANNPQPPDQRELVQELRRQNTFLRGEIENQRAERKKVERRLRTTENAVAKLTRRQASQQNSDDRRARQALPTSIPTSEANPPAAPASPAIVRNRRVPRSLSGRPFSSYRSRLPYGVFRDDSEHGAALRESARRRQDAEARGRAARRRAAVEVGMRQKRRSAFNRVFDQR